MELALNCISKTYKKGSVKALDNFSVTLTPGVYGLLDRTEQASPR